MTFVMVLSTCAVLLLWAIWAMCMVAKKADEQAEKQQHPISIEDLEVLAGSEGENLPGPVTIYTRKPIDLRKEVAEQLGV